MADDKFMWQDGDLEVEHPMGSGIFIPMRTFLQIMEAEEEEDAENAPAEEE